MILNGLIYTFKKFKLHNLVWTLSDKANRTTVDKAYELEQVSFYYTEKSRKILCKLIQLEFTMDKYLIPLLIIVIAIIFFYFRSSSNSEAAQKNIATGNQYLADNKSEPGVIATQSGLQYLVLTVGSGTEHPGPRDKVKVHYHGTLLDGTVFDSSVERGTPISFGLNQVITGWTEGVQLMVVGEKTRFFIPSNLAYGNRSTGKIQAGSLLIFEVELLAINP